MKWPSSLRIHPSRAPRQSKRPAQGVRTVTLRLEPLEDRLTPTILVVGPGEPYTTIGQAATAAHNGDTIEIQAGTYTGQEAIFGQNNLTIEGIGGTPVFNDTGYVIQNQKAIFDIQGNNVTVKNIECEYAHDTTGVSKNYCGIRGEGNTLTIENCSFFHNDDGILINNDANAATDNNNLTVSNSEFGYNGFGDGESHNMYIGVISSFTLEASYSHDANEGHLVKSRALNTYLLYNYLADGSSGGGSSEVDIPYGGNAYLVGNIIEKEASASNHNFITYNVENGPAMYAQQLYLVNNTLVNNYGGGTYVVGNSINPPTAMLLQNNIFAGGGGLTSGGLTYTSTTNLVSNNPGFVSWTPGTYLAQDYMLAPGSPAIDAGTDPGTVNGFNLTPVDEYVDPVSSQSRPVDGLPIDIGAYEYVSSSSTAPTVTTDPSNQTVTAGQTATFTAAASGNPTPTVQWQVSSDGGKTFTDISGATSTTLTLTNVTAAMNGDEYQAVFTNSVGTATSTAATLTVQFAPTVTINPSNQTVIAGSAATFTASANGNPTPTVQWQVSSDGGKTFSDISGATSTTLTLNSVTSAMNGYEYQAVFTNSVGTATSTAATLTVQAAPTVTTNPTDQTVTAGGSVSFMAAANGNPTATVQWQVSSDGGKTFTDISGATSTTLTLTNVTAAMNGDEYQAVFTNSVGTATSSAATLTVQFAPTVTINPSNQTVIAGSAAIFTASANGNPTPTVQWQVSSDGGKTFSDISGATSTTLTLTNVQLSQSGNEYQAVFTNSVGTATSTAATLTVQAASVITSANNTAFLVGQNGSFTVTVTGSPTPTLTVLGLLPSGIAFTANGNGTATLAGVPAAGTGGNYYITIKAHNGVGSDFTQNFALTVNPAPAPPSPQSPALKVPPLLGLINLFFTGVETVNAEGGVTVTYSMFGFTFITAKYDSSGNFVNATLLGFNVPTFVWFL